MFDIDQTQTELHILHQLECRSPPERFLILIEIRNIALGDVNDKLNILARLQRLLQFFWVFQQQRIELIPTSSPSNL